MTTTNKSNSTAPFSITTKEVKSLWSHIVNPDTHFDKELGWLKITFLLPEAEAKELNAVLLEQPHIAVKEFKAEGKKVGATAMALPLQKKTGRLYTRTYTLSQLQNPRFSYYDCSHN